MSGGEQERPGVSRLDDAAALADIPTGAVPTFAVVVVSYIAPDGGGGYTLATGGDAQLSQVVGLLALASHDMIHADSPPVGWSGSDEG